VSRYIDVTANIRGRTTAAVEKDVNARLSDLRFPVEYHAEIVTDKAGGFRNLQSSVAPYVIAVAIAIFLLMQAAFGSWRLAILAFFILPTALAGGIIAAALAGDGLSIGSYLGFLAVLGLSVRNGIDLIGRYLPHERARNEASGTDAAVISASERAAPIFITALAVAAALALLLFPSGKAGLEVIQPLAIVVLGGVITSTLLHLFVLPATLARFRLFEKSVELESSAIAKSKAIT
jgi:Cu/Ag efflux pump CusA